MVLLMIGLCSVAQGEALRTFVSEFHREFTNRGALETLDGTVFYDVASKKLSIEVREPLRQWMILQGFETLIYYPDKQQAFRLKSQTDAIMPFFVVFIGCMQEDFGLGNLGYTLARHEKKGNILTSVWSPPKNLAKLLGETILVYDANRLVRVEYRSPKGTLLREGIFSRHALFGGYYFPLEISISSKSKQESALEKVTYIQPQFNAVLPAEVKDFKLPPGVKVKEVDW